MYMEKDTPIIKEDRYRYMFVYDEAIKKHINNIIENTGSRSLADAIRNAIVFHSKKLVPEYAVKSVSPRPAYDSIEDRVKAKEDKLRQEALAKQAIGLEKGKSICSRLDGTPIDNKNGTFACQFPLYEKLGKRVFTGSRVVPFDMLGEEHIEAQYKGGTKEEIKAILKATPDK